MSKAKTLAQVLWTHQLTRQALVLKGLVSLTFCAYLVDHSLAVPVSLAGNFVWLWVDV